MIRTRLQPADRKASILEAAMACARKAGYDRMTRDSIAEQAACSTGLVSVHFKSMIELKKAVMKEAIRTGVVSIVADGLRVNDPQARRAPADLLRQAKNYLANR